MELTSLLILIVILAIIGVALYFLEQLPMSPPIRTLIRVVVILVIVLWLIIYFAPKLNNLL